MQATFVSTNNHTGETNLLQWRFATSPANIDHEYNNMLTVRVSERG